MNMTVVVSDVAARGDRAKIDKGNVARGPGNRADIEGNVLAFRILPAQHVGHAAQFKLRIMQGEATQLAARVRFRVNVNQILIDRELSLLNHGANHGEARIRVPAAAVMKVS